MVGARVFHCRDRNLDAHDHWPPRRVRGEKSGAIAVELDRAERLTEGVGVDGDDEEEMDI